MSEETVERMNKKVRERLFLDEVAALYSDFPTGTIIDTERPDFLIVDSLGVTGIELVDYVRGQAEGESVYRRDEMLWQRIADAAKAEFEASHTEPLMVHFHWYPHRHPRSSEVKQLATDAATAIATYIPTNLFGKVTLDYHKLGKMALSHYCHQISVTRMRDQTQGLWSSVNAGFISVQPDEIQYLFMLKDKKISDYLANCDTVWLLIVADGFHISSNVDLRDVEHHLFKSQFGRILFYDRINKKVRQLHTEWP